jgi:hypothetical protein
MDQLAWVMALVTLAVWLGAYCFFSLFGHKRANGSACSAPGNR